MFRQSKKKRLKSEEMEQVDKAVLTASLLLYQHKDPVLQEIILKPVKSTNTINLETRVCVKKCFLFFVAIGNAGGVEIVDFNPNNALHCQWRQENRLRTRASALVFINAWINQDFSLKPFYFPDGSLYQNIPEHIEKRKTVPVMTYAQLREYITTRGLTIKIQSRFPTTVAEAPVVLPPLRPFPSFLSEFTFLQDPQSAEIEYPFFDKSNTEQSGTDFLSFNLFTPPLDDFRVESSVQAEDGWKTLMTGTPTP